MSITAAENLIVQTGNTKGESITLPLTSYLTGLESAVSQLTFLVFILQNIQIQTSQTGGQWYSDTSPLAFREAIFLVMSDPSMSKL